jgi:hypothetical protein
MCIATVFSTKDKKAILKMWPDKLEGWKFLVRRNDASGWKSPFFHTPITLGQVNHFTSNKINLLYCDGGGNYRGGCHVFLKPPSLLHKPTTDAKLFKVVFDKKSIKTLGQQHPLDSYFCATVSQCKFATRPYKTRLCKKAATKSSKKSKEKI